MRSVMPSHDLCNGGSIAHRITGGQRAVMTDTAQIDSPSPKPSREREGSAGHPRTDALMRRGAEFLGTHYAIMAGAMSWVSERNLVSAISNAGGFGVIACGAMTPALLDAEIAATKALTAKPFGVSVAEGLREFRRADRHSGGDPCAAGLLTQLGKPGACGISRSPKTMADIGKTPTDVYLFSRLPEEDQRSLLASASAEERSRYLPHAHLKVRQEVNRARYAPQPTEERL